MHKGAAGGVGGGRGPERTAGQSIRTAMPRTARFYKEPEVTRQCHSVVLTCLFIKITALFQNKVISRTWVRSGNFGQTLLTFLNRP